MVWPIAAIGLIFYFQASAMRYRNDVENAFKTVIVQYSTDKTVAEKLWNEVKENYSGKDRHYHTLAHLENFYAQLTKCKQEVHDWETLVIAMVYHDVIYHSPDHKDEERSAATAVAALRQINYPEDKIKKCEALVLATKTHAYSTDYDTNLFNDADMSILGLNRDVYKEYIKNVRLEYGDSPQFDAGRKKILLYFLSMDRIFKTSLFHQLYEEQARNNITWEISTLP